MRISIISALTKERVIGKDNSLPWCIPEELQYFKQITLGKPVIMGRKTFVSLNYKPLPKRKNIVLTKNKKFFVSNKEVIVVHSIDDALKSCEDFDEVMIIGGSSIYSMFLPKANRMYLSFIHENYKGDSYFPYYKENEWVEVQREEKEQFTALILDKKVSKNLCVNKDTNEGEKSINQKLKKKNKFSVFETILHALDGVF